jgi:hypothetical protein
MCGGAGKKPWSALEIGSVIGGFIVFWPLGLVALGLKLVKGEVWPGSSEMKAPWKDWNKGEGFAMGCKGMSAKWAGQNTSRYYGSMRHGTSGNEAFDEYRKAQLDRLEAERRKLEDEQKAFTEYLAKLRKAKDQNEFDRFMAERNQEKPASE